MATRQFAGAVSVVLNTKGEIALKKDEDGKFSNDNVAELYDTVRKLAKERKAQINKYALFLVAGGTEPVLLANRYGNPYIALLPKRADGQTKKNTITKLA